MNPLLLDLIPWVREKYCCSQLLVLLALQTTGEENPALVRAMWGFCQGMGGGLCGLLTGGTAALSYFAGHGGAEDEAHPMAAALLDDYVGWFNERTSVYGGNTCERVGTALLGQVPTREGGVPDMTRCGDLLAECWEKILELCAAYGIDPTAPRS